MASGGGLSHVQVLVSSDYTLKKCLDLQKVVPALLKEKSLPKSFRWAVKLAKKKNNIGIILGAAKELNLDGFALFLNCLDSLQDEKHNEALSVLSTEMLMMTLPPEAQATKVIKRIVETHYCDTETIDAPENFHSVEAQAEHLSTPLPQPPEAQAAKVTKRIMETHYCDMETKDVPESFHSVEDETEKELHLSTPLPQPPEAQATNVIKKIEQTVIAKDEPKAVEASLDSICTTQEEKTAPPLHSSFSLPTSTIGNVESQTFTNTGGMFYSTTHGVQVHIPQESLPPTIQPFELKMTASLRGPYKFSEDCELCTAVIHLSCDPPIGEFCDWVTVEIPHCATEPQTESDLDHLCIMTAKDELISGVYKFHEDPEIEVDFSDAYKVVFKTRHFTRYVGTRSKSPKRTQRSAHGVQRSQYNMTLRERKQGSFDSHLYKSAINKGISEMQRSMSLPGSTAAHLPQCTTKGGNAYYVAMCIPMDRSQPLWKAVFLISYRHPTGLEEIKEAARRILGTQPEIEMNPFTFKGTDPAARCVEFVPDFWEDKGWKVESIKRPALIAETDVVDYFQLPDDTKKILNFSPHSLRYSVDGRNSSDILSLRVDVRNLRCHGREVSFLLTSTAVFSPATERLRGYLDLHIISDLYDGQSHFWRAVKSSNTVMQDLPLRFDDNDTRKFLTEISFQLPSWKDLASELQLDQLAIACLEGNYQCTSWTFEVAYQMLRRWITQKPHVATLGNLLTALRGIGLSVKPRSWQIKLQSLQHILQNSAHLEVQSEFACGLSERIGSQWKFVARQLGVPEYDIDNIESQEDKISEQAYQMLLKWKTISGRDATYGVLVNAVFAVDEHTNCLNDACCYFEKYIPGRQ